MKHELEPPVQSLARRRFIRLATSGTVLSVLGGYYLISDELTREPSPKMASRFVLLVAVIRAIVLVIENVDRESGSHVSKPACAWLGPYLEPVPQGLPRRQ